VKYYKDYKITLFDKYKLIAYYDLNFEECDDERVHNIYHIILENENKFGSYGIYANGLLVESTDEAGLGRFTGYEKINTSVKEEEEIIKETIFDKIIKKLNTKITKTIDDHVLIDIKNDITKIKTYKSNKTKIQKQNYTQKNRYKKEGSKGILSPY